jgi:hypothetical protein
MKNIEEKNINYEELIATETKRISEKYGKAFLDCAEIAELTGLGRDNARALMSGRHFPITRIGNRQVVSILVFVAWQVVGKKGVLYGA